MQNQRDPRLNEILFPLFDRKRVKSIIDMYEVSEEYRGAGQLQYRCVFEQVAQLSQRDRATHELLRFAKLRSGIFEPAFGGLGET